VGRFLNAKVDRAAGGLLVDVVDGVKCVAVVHRPRYDDWTLPKGHVEPGETWQETALREVLEETGIAAEIVGEPAAIGYMVDQDLPKIVVFYPMVPSGDKAPGAPDANEVDVLEWWPIDRARTDLTYVVEARLVAQVAPSRSSQVP